MNTVLTVDSWVAIREGCPMSCDILGSGEVHFLYGIPTDGFEFSFEAEALREFLELGSKALADMDARYAEEEAHEAAEPDVAAQRGSAQPAELSQPGQGTGKVAR